MIAVSGTKVRNNFKEYCDRVVDDSETLVITRERGENLVMLSEADYNNLMETIRIYANPEFKKKLDASISQYEAGSMKERELLDA